MRVARQKLDPWHFPVFIGLEIILESNAQSLLVDDCASNGNVPAANFKSIWVRVNGQQGLNRTTILAIMLVLENQI